MANNYSNCEKKYDRQLAAAFAVYMMAGSAFKKCICRNPLEEGHLCLHYREMPERLQLEAENAVLAGVKALGERRLAAMGDLFCEAVFSRRGGKYTVCFLTGGFEDLKIDIDGKGKISLR